MVDRSSAMNRLSYRLYRLASALRYRLPRRFTPAGLLALAALVASGAIGTDLDQTVAFQAFAFVAGLLAVAMVAALFFRGRFTVRRVLPRFGSVGQPFAYHVTIRNRTARVFRELEWLEELADPRPTLEEFVQFQRARRGGRRFRLRLKASPPIDHRVARAKPAALPVLPARGEAEARVELLPLRRGPLRFTGVTVARSDPFGLFRGFVRSHLRQTVLILPGRYPLPPITLPGTRQYQRGGVALAAAIGESEEFVSLRDYRPGDPLRHIHWRSWARIGRPIVKEFQDEHFVRHALILDTFAGPEMGEEFEEAVSVAASFACTVGTQESLLDLMFVGPQAVCFTTGRGLGQAEQALELLASVRPSLEKPFAALQDLVLRHARGVCGCVCVLLAWNLPRRELVRQLRALGLPVLVLIVVGEGQAAGFNKAPAEDLPEHFLVLEAGRIAEGLQGLKVQ
jgi:uncharacterized protein (DUF58 family)